MIALRRDTAWRQAAWILHRASGVGVLLFLLVHVGDTALVRLGPAAYDGVVTLYRNAAFRALEIILMGAVLFHAFNGLRVTVQDLWPGWLPFERSMLAAVYVATAAVWAVAAFFMATR